MGLATTTTDTFECRNCASHESRPLYANVPDRFHGFDGVFTYVACAKCGLVQLEHVPDDLGKFYTGYRIHSGDSRVYRALRRLTIGHCYLEVEGHGKKLLDIGCGNGAYMKQMRELGWQVSGYEFDPAYAAALSKELDAPVIAGEEALAQHAGEFDLVTFNFSFEHLSRPLDLLELAVRSLRPGGQIYISVPNIESREASLFRDKWFHLDPPRHVTFFTKEHLRDRLASSGFVDITVKNLPVPTGFAGSMSYRLMNKFNSLAWYAGIVPGMLFSRLVRDGNFAISARRPG